MSASTEAFCYRVVDSCPELAWMLGEHIYDNDSELLPHLFFGDVSRWVTAEAALRPVPPSVLTLLGTLDSAYADEDLEIRELIYVSFVENIWDEPSVTALLGAHLQQAWTEYTGNSTG